MQFPGMDQIIAEFLAPNMTGGQPQQSPVVTPAVGGNAMQGFQQIQQALAPQVQSQGGFMSGGLAQMLPGATGDLASAMMGYENTQNLRTAGIPGIGGALVNLGEMAYDAAREPEARAALAEQMDIAEQQKLAREDAIKRNRAQMIEQMTGNSNLAQLAYNDPKIAQSVVSSQLEDRTSTLEKEWNFMQQMPDGPDKERMKEYLLKQKETIMRMPLEFGYMYDKDGKIQLVPGEDNPRRIEQMNEHFELMENRWAASRAQAETIGQLENNVTQMERALNNIDWTSAGLVGKVMSQIPGTDAYNLYKQLDTLKATVAFQELIEMRNASKTGGALGNVSNREIELLYSSFAALDEGMSPEELRKSVQQLMHHYEAMRWGMANEKEYWNRVQSGDMTIDEARAELEAGKKQAADMFMLRQTGSPRAQAAYQAMMQGDATPDDYDEFEKRFGWKPKGGRSY